MTRCNFENCKKKLDLVPFECKCKLKFCKKHRLPEAHKCTYDFKKNGRELLKKNPFNSNNI